MHNFSDLSGKHVLIAGAAVGIGRQTALLLGELGARISMIDIDEAGLIALLPLLNGKGHLIYPFDLSNLEKIQEKIAELVKAGGSFDGLVHCASIRSRRPVNMINPQVLRKVMDINFGAFLELVRSITQRGSFNKRLSIIGISSVSAQRGGIGVTAYAASKAAMDAAVRCLAKELAPKGIRLNTVVLSQINTPAYSSYLESTGITEDPALTRQYLGLGEPLDVANVIAFLLSENARFITGSAIPVDGGYLVS
jgi:NAD(P)-dependent dehydrogenase (short-subunit alcohol dehydrogenase family)